MNHYRLYDAATRDLVYDFLRIITTVDTNKPILDQLETLFYNSKLRIENFVYDNTNGCVIVKDLQNIDYVSKQQDLCDVHNLSIYADFGGPILSINLQNEKFLSILDYYVALTISDRNWLQIYRRRGVLEPPLKVRSFNENKIYLDSTRLFYSQLLWFLSYLISEKSKSLFSTVISQ